MMYLLQWRCLSFQSLQNVFSFFFSKLNFLEINVFPWKFFITTKCHLNAIFWWKCSVGILLTRFNYRAHTRSSNVPDKQHPGLIPLFLQTTFCVPTASVAGLQGGFIQSASAPPACRSPSFKSSGLLCPLGSIEGHLWDEVRPPPGAAVPTLDPTRDTRLSPALLRERRPDPLGFSRPGSHSFDSHRVLLWQRICISSLCISAV